MRGSRDANASHAEHESQKFPGNIQRIRMRPVPGHQQPSRKPRLDHVKARAGSSLGKLAHEYVDESQHDLTQRGATLQMLLEGRSLEPQALVGSLHQRTQRCLIDPECQQMPAHAFVSDHACFKRVAIDGGEQ